MDFFMDFLYSNMFNLILMATNAICLLFCFRKMDIAPWAALVPVYGQWCLFENLWGRGWIYALVWVASFFVYPPVGTVLMSWALLAMFRRFGKGTLFCLMGVFLQPVALAICAFDRSEYYG